MAYSASPHADVPDREALLQLICFQVRGQDLALPITAVKETIAPRPLTRLPLCPPCIAGLINLRGEVVAVLDLGLLLGLPAVVPTPPHEARIILLRSQRGPRSHGALCGILVDRLTAPQRLPALRPLPPNLPEPAAAYVAGTARRLQEEGGQKHARLLLVLDPERLLAAEALRPYRRAPEGDHVHGTPRS
ncbi:MAG: chemotaxis protein CheW [Myxococcales bacterium]|nr:chemotaxis protein CheW [Myxococcota bacterium]MDW8282710.1 chemotaxis protein CheW [Myxococcales bacterium]